MNFQRGTIIKSTGSWYKAMSDGKLYELRLRGKFRISGIKTTNPLAVGDEVDFAGDETNGYFIFKIIERKNYLIRKAVKASHLYQIIAANVNQAVLVTSIAHPSIALGFVDRFLVNCEAYNIPCILVINKTDLEGEFHPEELEYITEMYTKIGYKVFQISTLNPETIEDLKKELVNKTSLFSGFSGVGKSSLLNLIIPAAAQRVDEISESNEKGKHTTTFAEMFWNDEMKIVDTPGIKEMGLIDIEKWELAHYFRDMVPFAKECKYNNCIHINEPHCAVLTAIEQGEINLNRYQSYLSIMEEVFNPEY